MKKDIMNSIDQMEDSQFIFGIIFVIANRMDTLLERELKEFDITSKQWFLSIIVDNLFHEPPTIKEVAKEMGSSHQNIKQVALKLEEKGLLKLERDKKDARITRLILTEQSYQFWEKTESKGLAFTQAIFNGIGNEDLSIVRTVLNRIISNLIIMESENKE